MLETIQIEIPEGFKLKYQVYKVRSLFPTHVESRGRNPTLDPNSKDLKPKQEWTVKNRTHVKYYNREYYLKNKAKKKATQQEEQTNAQHEETE